MAPASPAEVLRVLASRVGRAYRWARADMYSLRADDDFPEVFAALASLLMKLGEAVMPSGAARGGLARGPRGCEELVMILAQVADSHGRLPTRTDGGQPLRANSVCAIADSGRVLDPLQVADPWSASRLSKQCWRRPLRAAPTLPSRDGMDAWSSWVPQSTDSQTALQVELLRGICGENRSESESENENGSKSESEGESESEMVKREVAVTGADYVVDDGDDDDGNDDDGYPVVDSFDDLDQAALRAAEGRGGREEGKKEERKRKDEEELKKGAADLQLALQLMIGRSSQVKETNREMEEGFKRGTDPPDCAAEGGA